MDFPWAEKPPKEKRTFEKEREKELSNCETQ